MKRLKLFSLAGLLTLGSLFTPNQSEAKIVSQWAYQFENGCIGTRTVHSTLFGLITWETYEWVDCPDGVSPPEFADEWQP